MNQEKSELKIFDTFKINENGRPEGTVETDLGVLHYTCNSPDRKVLDEFGIIAVGKKFNVDSTEVLLIPRRIFQSFGLERNTVGSEILLRDISV